MTPQDQMVQALLGQQNPALAAPPPMQMAQTQPFINQQTNDYPHGGMPDDNFTELRSDPDLNNGKLTDIFRLSPKAIQEWGQRAMSHGAKTAPFNGGSGF